MKNEADRYTALEMFEECSALSTPAIITPSDLTVQFQARFAAVSPESLTFQLLSDRDGSIPGTGSRCGACFGHRHRLWGFVATVRKCVPRRRAHQAPSLTVETPSQVVKAENRRSFRVPVRPSEEGGNLRVRITTVNREEWVGEALDISMSGILLDLVGDDSPNVSIDSEVQVELQLGRRVVGGLSAVVRHNEEGCLGLFFPDTIKLGQLQPPKPLRSIVTILERRWLRRRIPVRNPERLK